MWRTRQTTWRAGWQTWSPSATDWQIGITEMNGNYSQGIYPKTTAQVGGDGVMVVNIPSSLQVPEGYYWIQQRSGF